MKKHIKDMMSIIDQMVCDSIGSCHLDSARLYALIKTVTPDVEKAAQIVRYLQGKFTPEELPNAFNHKEYADAKMVSYNFFSDVVIFEYTSTSKRYYKTQEEADRFSKEGCGWSYETRPTDTHTFEGVYVRRCTNDVNKHRWMELYKQSQENE
jgi:hypothetical protein